MTRPKDSRAIAAPLVALALLTVVGTGQAADLWVEVDQPAADSRVRAPTPLVEVRGWAGAQARGPQDVVLLLDRSASVWGPSGSDLDGDGVVGSAAPFEERPPKFASWSSDPDDSILRAELEAARQIIYRLPRRTTRIGIIEFGGDARLSAPVALEREPLYNTLSALGERVPNWGETHLARAIELGTNTLSRSPPDRRRSLILLTDGLPTAPRPPWIARRITRYRLLEARDAGLEVLTIVMGPAAARNHDAFHGMLRDLSELEFLEKAGDIEDFIPALLPSPVERVEITNLDRPRARVRALRVFPDGTFDAFIPLTPGPNRIRIRALGAGTSRTLHRRVDFEPMPREDPRAATALETLRRELAIRTVETELAEPPKLRAAPRGKELQIRVEGETGTED